MSFIQVTDAMSQSPRSRLILVARNILYIVWHDPTSQLLSSELNSFASVNAERMLVTAATSQLLRSELKSSASWNIRNIVVNEPTSQASRSALKLRKATFP